MKKDIFAAWLVLTFLFSCKGQNNTKGDDIDTISTTTNNVDKTSSSVIEADNNSNTTFYKDVEIIKKRHSFKYYKKYNFSSVDEAKSRLIFNNISKLNISEMAYDPLSGGSIINYGDVVYEEFLFDTLKLSNTELENGIIKVLNEINKLKQFQGLTLREDEDDKKDYNTKIEYYIDFADTILTLKKIITISKDEDHVKYVTELIEVKNLKNIFLEEVFNWTNARVVSLLPALKNNKKLNTYYLNNSCVFGDKNLYEKEIKVIKYLAIEKYSDRVLQTHSETQVYKKIKPTDDSYNGLSDLGPQCLYVDNTQFIVNDDKSVLLFYLRILFDRLRRNLESS